MTEREQEFLRRLRATFKVEAGEHMQAISSGLVELEKRPDPSARAPILEAVFRHTHSLKGAARAINYAEVEALCQALEDVFAAGKRGTLNLSPEIFDALHRGVDLVGKLILAVEAARPPEEKNQITAARRMLAQLLTGERRDSGLIATAPAIPQKPIVGASLEAARRTAAGGGDERRSRESEDAVAPAPTAAVPVRSGLAETIRIPTAKLDRLLLQAEEMLAVKQRVAQRDTDLREFEILFDQLTQRWASIESRLRSLQPTGASSPAEAPAGPLADWNFGEIKALEEKLRALRKSAAHDHHAVGKQVGDLLADSKNLVMLPFSTLSDLLPKLVRDLSRDQGKDVGLVVLGGEVEVDKRILEEMKDPLIHLLRNCVDHGIEPPAQRAARGKPLPATVTVAITLVEGNRLEIGVSDNGAGIDVERVKEAAVRRGVIPAEKAGLLGEQEALALIFLSDVTTSPIITEISGRGLGLAIVRENAEKLGGRVIVDSHRHVGTHFRLVLPVALSTFHGVLVRVMEQTLVIPTANVERVARIKAADIKTVENRETVTLDGRVISLARLAEVLEIPRDSRPQPSPDILSVVVLGTGDDRIAFGVDDVLRDEEVLVKQLVRPLSRVRNVASATVLASGKVAPILNPTDLIKSGRKLRSVPASGSPSSAAAPPAAAVARAKSILVAEDSITSRMLLKGILESAGYRVRTATDGIEALTLLRTEDFDLVVSDVEMPRMNGFDLTTSIRADKRLADKPVVLVTALASPADREHGVDVGANAYIVKGSFDQSNLLEAVRRLA